MRQVDKVTVKLFDKDGNVKSTLIYGLDDFEGESLDVLKDFKGQLPIELSKVQIIVNKQLVNSLPPMKLWLNPAFFNVVEPAVKVSSSCQ